MTKRFYPLGQQNVSSAYFYALDQNRTIHQMCDNTGNLVSDRNYDLFGRVSINSESIAPDFGFAAYYLHAPSALSLAEYRAYDANLARWINRDPGAEISAINLYTYVLNRPEILRDPSGLGNYGNPFTPPVVATPYVPTPQIPWPPQNLPWPLGPGHDPFTGRPIPPAWPFNGKPYPWATWPNGLPKWCPTKLPRPTQLNPWSNYPDWPPQFNEVPYDPYATPPGWPGNPGYPPNSGEPYNFFPKGPIFSDPLKGLA